MAEITVSTPYVREFIMVLASDHVSPAAGKTVAVQISKAGAPYSAPAGVVSEIGTGRYAVAFTSADTNTLGDLGFVATAGGCDNTDLTDQVVPASGSILQVGTGPRNPINGPFVGRGAARSDVPIFARLRDPTSFVLLTQAAVATITYNVQDLTTQLSVGSGSLALASVVFNALQQGDPAWTQDGAANQGVDGTFGYNFRWTAPASLFVFTPAFDPVGNPKPRKFQIDIKFTLANGGVFELIAQWQAIGTFA